MYASLFEYQPECVFAGGFDINSLDDKGLTPLMWSAAYGQVPTAALLLKAGASHSIKGPDGETAIHLAAAGGHTDIIRLLIAAGATVNEVDDVNTHCIFHLALLNPFYHSWRNAVPQNSNTPLMFAAYGNHAHALNELLNHSADLTLTNINDDSALSIAIKRSSKEGTGLVTSFQRLPLSCNRRCNSSLFFFLTAQSVIEGYLFMLLQPS